MRKAVTKARALGALSNQSIKDAFFLLFPQLLQRQKEAGTHNKVLS